MDIRISREGVLNVVREMDNKVCRCSLVVGGGGVGWS